MLFNILKLLPTHRCNFVANALLMKGFVPPKADKTCTVPQEAIPSAHCKAGFGSEAKKPAVGRNTLKTASTISSFYIPFYRDIISALAIGANINWIMLSSNHWSHK